ncbi:MAG: hypothetical protein RMJ33_14705, partial [Saprospiraceae bacterium]|nr:hypothetical protein [Saprospiraceae bacterium]
GRATLREGNGALLRPHKSRSWAFNMEGPEDDRAAIVKKPFDFYFNENQIFKGKSRPAGGGAERVKLFVRGALSAEIGTIFGL